MGFKKKYNFRNERIIINTSTLLLGNPYKVKQIHSREKQQKYQRRKSLHRLFDLDFSSIFSWRLSRISCPFGSKKRQKFEYHNKRKIWKNFIFIWKPKKDLWLTSVHNENWLSFHMILKKKKKNLLGSSRLPGCVDYFVGWFTGGIFLTRSETQRFFVEF